MDEKCTVAACARPVVAVVHHPYRGENIAVCDHHRSFICEEAGGEVVE